MQAKPEARAKAIELRQNGHSIGEIALLVGASEGSVHNWTHHIILSEEQQVGIRRRAGNQLRAADGARNARIKRWATFRAAAEAEWPSRRTDPLFMFGLALYIGEGGKTQPNTLRVSNSDPRVIRKVMNFYLSLGVPKGDIRASIYMYDKDRVPVVEIYWQSITGLPAVQFYRTSVTTSRAGAGVRGNTIPNGTLHLGVNSTEVRQKIERWMELALAP